MNEIAGAEQSVSGGGKTESNRFISVCVSGIALFGIANSWKSFSWFDELLAIMFLFLLLSGAVGEFTGQRKGFEFFAREPVSSMGYCLIMLAIVLFGRH